MTAARPIRRLLIDGGYILRVAWESGCAPGDFRAVVGRYAGLTAPDEVRIALDPPRATLHRRALCPTYKANRPPRPAGLAAFTAAVVDAWPDLCWIAPGHEADDVIATWARELREAGVDTSATRIVSADRDLLPIGLPVWRWHERRAELLPRLSGTDAFTSAQLYDLKAIAGDPSDNIAGIPGVGIKTAVRILTAYPNAAAAHRAASSDAQGFVAAVTLAGVTRGAEALVGRLLDGWPAYRAARRLVALRTDAVAQSAWGVLNS